MDQATRNCLPFPAEIRNLIYNFVLAVSYNDDLEINNCCISYRAFPRGGTVYDVAPTSLDLSLLLV